MRRAVAIHGWIVQANALWRGKEVYDCVPDSPAMKAGSFDRLTLFVDHARKQVTVSDGNVPVRHALPAAPSWVMPPGEDTYNFAGRVFGDVLTNLAEHGSLWPAGVHVAAPAPERLSEVTLRGRSKAIGTRLLNEALTPTTWIVARATAITDGRQLFLLQRTADASEQVAIRIDYDAKTIEASNKVSEWENGRPTTVEVTGFEGRNPFAAVAAVVAETHGGLFPLPSTPTVQPGPDLGFGPWR
jgi:hypothetical protein